MIQPNGRIEQIDGMHFYEQDIVMLEYIYENSIKAIINLDYRYPGFGVVLATPANNQSAAFTNFAYLFRVGDGEWTIDSLWLDKQKRVAQGTTPLYSDYKKQNNFVLTFKYDKVQDLAEWYIDVVDKQTGVSNTVRIMSYQMKEKIEEFRVGFYSNKNNTIKGASIYDERPQFWFTNIKNSNGGRISFKRNQIMFENTDEDLEVEEQLILLKKGTYYFDYTAELAENGHVEAYVIPSEYKMLQIDPSKKDLIKHNIVKDNNVIEIEEDMEVNVLISGKNATVKNITIKDNPYQTYVSTGESTKPREGSEIVFHADKLKKIKAHFYLEFVPSHDLDELLPYYIYKHDDVEYDILTLNIQENHKYSIVFEKDTETNIWKISIYEDYSDTLIYENVFGQPNDNLIRFFYNVCGYVDELIITDIEGNDNNIILERIYREYVSSKIESPILVTDTKESPYDLSASYRYDSKTGKYRFTNWEREFFEPSKKLILEKPVIEEPGGLIVYGIKDDFDDSKEEIDFDKMYDVPSLSMINNITPAVGNRFDEISSSLITVSNSRVLYLDISVMDKKYKYLIIDYMKNKSYCINQVDNGTMYKVEISTDEEDFKMMYDMAESGQIKHYKILDNTPETGRYLTLEKEELLP